jgi:ATP-dependent exoDNAse (exonuclease V) beta subunit
MSHILEFSHGSVTLNEEQFKVVTSPISENQRILASAGSGKTTTITARIAYLVESYDIDPSKILLVTFSRAAAQEMIHRVRHLIGPVNIYAGTFHALSAQILRDMAPKMLADQPFIDELPYRMVKWLETDKAKKWVQRFRTIIVDEFQDINEIQWQLIKGFYHQWATMTIVGDDAQNIYTWRGSSVDFILNFHNFIPRATTDYQLCMNYRSTEAIVTVANSVMRFIPTLPFKEKMIANARGGRKPEVHFFFRASDEYDWIVNSLEKFIKAFTGQGNQNFTFAVISRYNHDLFKIEERLHLKKIPYNLCTDYDPERTKKNNKRVTLATIHASKGLEWDIVFFMNLHDDMFPSRKSDEEIVCERRLFYVAVTRAKKGLYMTYSRHERSLSRFVREIPRPFLRFHNIAAFKLSTNEAAASIMSLEDMIRGFDGADWGNLRTKGHVPTINNIKTESIYQFSQMFSMPEWVRQFDARETWLEMLRWVALREAAIHHNKLDELITPEVNECLLTLRVYREDIEFWEEYEAEMEHLVHKFLKHSPQMPAVEYHELDSYVKTKLRHLNWSVQEMSHALVIIAKIRGQLRPLRHHGFDLNEFSFGLVRNSVPTELRPEVLSSWHNIINKNMPTHTILGDIWRIASIKSVIEGRNIPLYQLRNMGAYLLKEEQQAIVKAVERAVPLWIVSQENPIFNFIFEIDEIRPIQFDILTEKCAYYIYFDPMYVPTMEDKILLLLKQYAYEEMYDRVLESIGFLNVATGVVIKYEITATIREQLSHMWLYLQTKYNLYQEV